MYQLMTNLSYKYQAYYSGLLRLLLCVGIDYVDVNRIAKSTPTISAIISIQLNS